MDAVGWVPYFRYLVGGSVDTGSYYCGIKYITTNYGDGSSNQENYYGNWATSVNFQLGSGACGGTGNDVDGGMHGEIDFYDPLNTTQWKSLKYTFTKVCTDDFFQYQAGFMAYKNTNAVSGFRVNSDAGNEFINLDASLYGIKS